MVEQMMPQKTLGRHYVLGSNLQPATLEIVKVVPIDDNVRFSYGGSCFTSSGTRQVYAFRRQSDVLVEIMAEKQILVAQFVTADDNNTGVPDAVMNLPVPVYQWSSSYRVYVPATDPADADDVVHLHLLTYSGATIQSSGIPVSCMFFGVVVAFDAFFSFCVPP